MAAAFGARCQAHQPHWQVATKPRAHISVRAAQRGLARTLIQLRAVSPQDIDATDFAVLMHKQLMLVSFHDVTFCKRFFFVGQVESLTGSLSDLHGSAECKLGLQL